VKQSILRYAILADVGFFPEYENSFWFPSFCKSRNIEEYDGPKADIWGL
jgi:hypothetical protein